MTDSIIRKPVMLPQSQQHRDFTILSKQLGNEKLVLGGVQRFGEAIPQHLYLISEEEIKEGDWYYWISHSEPMKCDKRGAIQRKNCFKIVSTTNKSLGLPLIPESFIKLYVEKQGKIDKVRVQTTRDSWGNNTKCPVIDSGSGEVIILPIEDKMYTAEDARMMAVRYHDIRVTQGVTYADSWLQERYPLSDGKEDKMYSRNELYNAWVAGVTCYTDHPIGFPYNVGFDEWFDKTYPI